LIFNCSKDCSIKRHVAIITRAHFTTDVWIWTRVVV